MPLGSTEIDVSSRRSGGPNALVAFACVVPLMAALGTHFLAISTGVVTLDGYWFALIGGLAAWIIGFRSGRKRPRAAARLLYALSTIIIIGTLSLLWTPDFHDGLVEILIALSAAAWAILAYSLVSENRNGITLLRRGWVVAYVICGGIALWEIVTHHHLASPYVTNLPYYASRSFAASTFDNPNDYGAFIVIASPFLIWSYLVATGWLRALYFVSLVSVPLLLAETGARLGVIALGLEVIVFIILVGRVLQHPARLVKVALVVPVMVALTINLVPSLVVKANNLSDQNGSVTQRFNLIRDGISFTASSYTMGVGAAGFESKMENGSPPFPTEGITDPHNFWIELMSEYGLVPFLMLFGWTLSILNRMWKMARKRRSPDPSDLYPVAAMAMLAVGYIVVVGDPSTFFREPINWVALGSLAAVAGYSTDRRRPSSGEWRNDDDIKLNVDS